MTDFPSSLGSAWAPTSRAPLSRAEVDLRLGLLVQRTEKVSAALLDLDDHPGLQILRNYPQAGATAAAWRSIQEAIRTLWADLDRHKAVVAAAQAIRARRSRPTPDELDELTALLRGPSAEVGAGTLTGSGTSGRVTLDELADRMNAAYQTVIDQADRVDAAAATVRDGLGPAQEALRADMGCVEEPDAAAGRDLAEKFSALNERSVTDALSIPDPAAAVAELVAAQAAWHRTVQESAVLQATWPDRVAALKVRAAEVGIVTARARQARTEAMATIAGSPLPAAPDPVGAVNELVTAVDRASGWPDRRRAYAAADREVTAALAQARAAEELAAGLLRRRAELRGRLTAFRAKATRLGRADAPAAAQGYRAAADALAITPCDLAAATRLVAAYQDLVTEPRRSA